MARCDYCKKQGAVQKTAVRIWEGGKTRIIELNYCSDNCKLKLHSFAQSYNRFAPKSMLIALVWILLLAGAPLILRTLTGNSYFTELVSPLLMAFMGLVLVFQPNGIMSVKYYRRVGIRYFTGFIRITGLLMFVSGLSVILT